MMGSTAAVAKPSCPAASLVLLSHAGELVPDQALCRPRRVLPPRVSEVVGVCHLKAYVFDDSVLLSGANLSNTYFSTRQDRYYAFRDAPALAAHIRSLVQVRAASLHLLVLP